MFLAVSLMFLSFGQINALRFALYTLVQIAGAFVGALIAFLVINLLSKTHEL